MPQSRGELARQDEQLMFAEELQLQSLPTVIAWVLWLAM